MRQHHIGVREASSIGILFIITKIFLPFPRSMAELGGTAAWIIVLISALLSPLSWWGIRGVISNGRKGSSLITATEEILGPYLGNLINLAYFFFFFLITFIVLREFSEILATDILPRTPLNVTMLSLLIPISFVAFYGIETIGRISWFFIGLVLASIVVLLLGGLYTHTEPNALAPFWGTGKSRVFQMGLVKSSLFSELLVLGYLMPKMRKETEWARTAWWCLTISSFVFLCVMIVSLYVFPYPTLSRINTPLFEISRIINFGRWIQRVEVLFLVVWLLCTVIKLAIGLYCSSSTLAQILRLPTHQPLIFPLSILAFSLSLTPKSEMTAIAWDTELLRKYGAIISICLPILTWIVGEVRNRRRKT
ncbi:GerAB/ArcD/ProY family transporter [Paenibacillus planticolens]|uniref:GerAB/ArcD/ProY family transporter n=1 Tax=Paenibacillus planticolens TaxID=2654976 RepID=A0ABX1ZXQ9_9BACL|nr:endospore germination permease [Paenibacillus planticolens]NOV03845.1 GerAB/ArcD/ProY family transporter [Paenibacillus planticolens]